MFDLVFDANKLETTICAAMLGPPIEIGTFLFHIQDCDCRRCCDHLLFRGGVTCRVYDCNSALFWPVFCVVNDSLFVADWRFLLCLHAKFDALVRLSKRRQ